MSKKYRNKDWLKKKYVEEGMSDKEISDICDVSPATICRNRSKLGIEGRDELTEEQKQKISESVSQHLEENGHPFKGETHSKEAKQKMSEAKSGENNHFYGESRPEFAEKMKGKNNPSYKDGRTSEMDFRKQTKWKNFSSDIKEKADWTCENCSSHGSEAEIQTHHAHTISNGGDKFDNVFIVLCKDCHGNKSSFWHNSTVGEQIAKIGGEPAGMV